MNDTCCGPGTILGLLSSGDTTEDWQSCLLPSASVTRAGIGATAGDAPGQLEEPLLAGRLTASLWEEAT